MKQADYIRNNHTKLLKLIQFYWEPKQRLFIQVLCIGLMNNTIFFLLTFLALATSIAIADSVTVSGKLFSSVYIVKDSEFLYIHIPDTGELVTISKRRVGIENLIISEDDARRNQLYSLWKSQQDRIREKNNKLRVLRAEELEAIEKSKERENADRENSLTPIWKRIFDSLKDFDEKPAKVLYETDLTPTPLSPLKLSSPLKQKEIESNLAEADDKTSIYSLLFFPTLYILFLFLVAVLRIEFMLTLATATGYNLVATKESCERFGGCFVFIVLALFIYDPALAIFPVFIFIIAPIVYLAYKSK